MLAQPAADAVERVGQLIVGDVTIRVDEFDGVFRCSPKSHLFTRIVRDGRYEPELARLFLNHVQPNRDVLDVGANIGFFTIAAARRLTTGRVLAVEPTPGAFARLRANVTLNEVEPRVVLFNGVASDAEGEAELSTIADMEEYSSLRGLVHPSTSGQITDTVTVAAQTIDALVLAHELSPALLKIDVEGAEALVLGGARETLARYRPVVLSELSNELLSGFGTDGRRVVAMFRDLGYRVIDPVEPNAAPGTKDFGDILCLPG